MKNDNDPEGDFEFKFVVKGTFFGRQSEAMSIANNIRSILATRLHRSDIQVSPIETEDN